MATGITQEDVWNAADMLLLEGARPTIERVRQKIGRGSPNTVSPYLDTWFRGLGARIGNGSGLAASTAATVRDSDGSALPTPIADTAMQLWTMARQAARAELAEEASRLRVEADAQRELLAKERDQVSQHAQRLEARERDLQESIAMLRSQLHAAEARAQGLAQEQQRTLEQIADMAAQAREARHAHDRLAEQMQSEHAAHIAERTRADERARAQETRWLNELDAAREASKRLQQQLDRAIRSADIRQEKMNQELAQSQQATAQAEAARTRLQEALASTQRELGETRAQLSQMSVALQDRSGHIDALHNQLEQNRQANERAFALHAAREAEWSLQAAQWRAELQDARGAASRAQAETAARDQVIEQLRAISKPARKMRDTPDAAP